MNILITKCTTPSAWYASRVGQILPVERHEINRHPSQGISEDVYWCREGGTYNAINYVLCSDAMPLQSMTRAQLDALIAAAPPALPKDLSELERLGMPFDLQRGPNDPLHGAKISS